MAMMTTVLDADGVGAYLGLHAETVRRFAREGKIPAYKIGGRWRFNREALDQWAQEQGAIRLKKKALVVEDERAVLDVLCRTLDGAGIEPLAAAAGAEAISLYLQEGADVIVLDLMLPDMTGADVLARISPQAEDIPVMVLTAYPDSEMVMRVMEHGPIILLAKPVPPDRVLALVQTVLKSGLPSSLEASQRRGRARGIGR